MKTMNKAAVLLLLAALIKSPALLAYESAYPMAETGSVEIIRLPAARLLEARMNGNYFQGSNKMFMRLFDYIKTNDIAMTVPVEAQLENAGMRFYLGSDAPTKLDNTDEVGIVELPQRQVLRLGGKGSYSESNINQTIADL